ncbi:MAG: hypothetical protein K0R18_571 [Bacillales bacterium]|jgi:hypothetical protein|nr:hypothetical protein [Bacillales bacterium]
MEIKLLINDKEKTFKNLFVKGRMLRRALEINKKMDFSKLSEEDLDGLVDYVCEVFNGQFSRDNFYDGIEVGDMVPTIQNVMENVAGKASGESKNPNS